MNPEQVGIKAKTIKAENIVIGAQITTIQNPEQSHSEFYLRRVIKNCDPLDLGALDDSCLTDGREVRNIRVSDVFTTLYLKDIRQMKNQSVAEAVKTRETRVGVPIQAAEATAALNRIVILGRPGGGKSTLVNYIAAQLARRKISANDAQPLPGWDETQKPMPVRIILRQFASKIGNQNKKGTEKLVWDYRRSTMNKDEKNTGGIRAGKIYATNIVDGVQTPIIDAQTAAGLILLAKEIRRGGISADEIRAKNIVSGLQCIPDPANATIDDLRREIEVLKQRISESIKAGEITDRDAEDAKDAIVKVETEIKAKAPLGDRIVRKLGELTEILTKGAEVMEAAGNLKAQIIQLAPYAAAIYLAAQNVLR